MKCNDVCVSWDGMMKWMMTDDEIITQSTCDCIMKTLYKSKEQRTASIGRGHGRKRYQRHVSFHFYFPLYIRNTTPKTIEEKIHYYLAKTHTRTHTNETRTPQNNTTPSSSAPSPSPWPRSASSPARSCAPPTRPSAPQPASPPPDTAGAPGCPGTGSKTLRRAR